jgi:hypothetical protein
MRQLVEFVNDHHFEALLLLCVQLLAACDFLNQLLHNDSIVELSLARRHLYVVHRREHNRGAGGAGGCADFELFLFTLYSVHRIRTVERLQ